MEPDDFTVIGYIDDLLIDIYAAENGTYLYFTVLLNASDETAQSLRNKCLIRAVKVRNLGQNPHVPRCTFNTQVGSPAG